MADMNVSPARPGLTPVIWQSDFWVEYLRENQFSVYFGTTMDAMIQLQTDLTRKRGDRVVFPTVRSLVGAGVTGNVILEGNEEVINARSRCRWSWASFATRLLSATGTSRNRSSICSVPGVRC